MNQARFVYVTCESEEQARSIGRSLVEERLIACANLLPGMESVYRWEGKVEDARETVLILKTMGDLVPALTERVKELHGYEVPCVVSLPIDGGNPDYLAWISDQTERPSGL